MSPDSPVRLFHQILLWPVQLVTDDPGVSTLDQWAAACQRGPQRPWAVLDDEFTADPELLQERHYREFVTFLPHVQRFLYGQGFAHGSGPKPGESPIRVYRRTDTSACRLTFDDRFQATLAVQHIDLYFFHDIDVVLLAVELVGHELPLERVQDIMFRFGRAFPTGWDSDGRASHCMAGVEWLDKRGEVLCASDFDDRKKFLVHAGRHRSARIGAHWEFLLNPLQQDCGVAADGLRYRQLEYHRMPKLSYLAVDDPRALGRYDYVRLAMGVRPRHDVAASLSESAVRGIEHDTYYDRFWSAAAGESPMRVICNGHALTLVGSARDAWFLDNDQGLLGQFRHQYFLVGLIAHFHKAALLQMSNRLVAAVSALEPDDRESKTRFKQEIRTCLETFLRFSHRYWFHEVSNQTMAQDLYAMFGRHLRNRESFAEIREEVLDMGQYLDSEDNRRNAQAILRLTVVTIVGLVGTIVTGFLGMNLIAEAEQPLVVKIAFFFSVLVPTSLLTLLLLRSSNRLSSLLEVDDVRPRGTGIPQRGAS